MPSGLFTLKIDNFQITNTRSAHTDTVYVSVAVKVGSETPLTVGTPKSLGNLNNGTFTTGVSCPNFAPIAFPLVLNYLIVNVGSSPASTVLSTMEELGAYIANTPGLNLPPFASALELVTQDPICASILKPIFKAGSCDGLVAAEQNTFTSEELLSYTARSPYFTQATSHIGPKAGSGCNSNGSAYLVHWRLANVADVPNVVKLPDGTNMPVGEVGEPDTAADTLSKAGFRWQLNPGGPDPNRLWVTKQSISSPPTQSVSEPVILTTTTTQP